MIAVEISRVGIYWRCALLPPESKWPERHLPGQWKCAYKPQHSARLLHIFQVIFAGLRSAQLPSWIEIERALLFSSQIAGCQNSCQNPDAHIIRAHVFRAN